MKDNINALDELNKGATMGINAINIVIKYVKDEKFKDALIKQYADYEAVSDKVKSIYKKHSLKKPHETSMKDKMMLASGIKMNTMKDKSNSKIAEILIEGTTMGIIEGRKMLNNKDIDKEIYKLISAFVKIQEECVERLKLYL